MNVKVTQENLHKALSSVSRVASQRGALPILSNILLHTEDKSLFLTATNLELAVRVRVAGKVQKDGRLAVPARLLNDFISSLPGGTISLSQTKQHALKVSMKNYESVINGADPEEYPSIPARAPGETIILSAAKLKQALQQITLAASTDEARQTLTGVYIHSNKDGLYMVATDSYRLAEKKLSATAKNVNHNVPAATMQEVLRNLSDSKDEKAEITLNENQAVFSIDTTVIISRLIDGKYPDYKQIIPAQSDVVAEVDREELLAVVRVASLFAKESAGSVTINIQEDSQQISVEAVASQVGENTSSTPAKVEGSGEVSLNSRYLIDALQVMTGQKVSFMISGKHSPCVLRPLDKSADYLHLIMPLKS